MLVFFTLRCLTKGRLLYNSIARFNRNPNKRRFRCKEKTDELMTSRVTLFDPILEDLQVIFTQK